MNISSKQPANNMAFKDFVSHAELMASLDCTDENFIKALDEKMEQAAREIQLWSALHQKYASQKMAIRRQY